MNNPAQSTHVSDADLLDIDIAIAYGDYRKAVDEAFVFILSFLGHDRSMMYEVMANTDKARRFEEVASGVLRALAEIELLTTSQGGA